MKPNKPTEKSFIQSGATLYEMVGDPNTKQLLYIKYNQLERSKELVPELELDGVTYQPPQNNLAFNGTILLPTYPSEYGSFGELLENVRSFINEYLELPEEYLVIASYYVVLTWVYDCFETIPYLRARGEYGTGKSRFLRVIGSICYRPCFAGGSSTVSPIFRLIDLYGGLTLILDEADFRFSGPDAEIIKILNTGYSKGTPVLRTEGDKVRVPTAYITYGPKIIATRKEFSDLALESRCLTNYMGPMIRKDIPLHLPESFYRMAQEMRNQLLMFRLEHYGTYEIDSSQAIAGVEPRINQVLLPLFALAESTEAKEELQKFAKEHSQTQVTSRSETLEGDVLDAIALLATENAWVPMKRVAERLNEKRNKEQGDFIVSGAKIGRINKTSFGFTTRKVQGATELLWEPELGRALCERYGIAVDDVGDVEDIFGAKLEPPDSGVPDKEASHE